jgi:hypothetical protein
MRLITRGWTLPRLFALQHHQILSCRLGFVLLHSKAGMLPATYVPKDSISLSVVEFATSDRGSAAAPLERPEPRNV